MIQTLLAYTSEPERQSDGFEQLLPIGLCSLHAVLRSRGYPVTLANLSGVSLHEIRQLLLSRQPRVIGLSQWTHNRHVTLALARLIKQQLPESLVILGGGHATHQAELTLQHHPEVDLVVTGEAEETLPELLDALANQTHLNSIPGLVLRQGREVQQTAPRTPVQQLDLLPFPAQYLDEMLYGDPQLQAEFLAGSRGCPAACRFCASPVFWGRRVRFRSATSIADEMRFLRDTFGLIYLSLRDDTFTADRQRTRALCQELLHQKIKLFWNCQSRVEAIDAETLQLMRQAGCECVQLGVESGSPRMLQLLGKNSTPDQIIRAATLVRQAGMQLSIYLITGIPEEEEADRQLTLKLVQQMRPDDLQVAPLAYYPGTELFKQAVQTGNLRADLFETSRSKAVLALPDGPRLVDQLLSRTARYRHCATPAALQQLISQNGYSAVTAMQLGDTLMAAGDSSAAATAYGIIADREPDHPWGWFLLGEWYEQQGDPEYAVDCYSRVLELVPRHLPSGSALQRLLQR